MLKLTSWGTPIKNIECLDPMNVTIYPNERFPTKAPNAIIDPIQETTSTETAPVFNGLSSDWSNGRAVESQPTPQPSPTNNKFAFVEDVLC